MLKVFDKVVSEAPFLHDAITTENQQKKYLFILNIILFCSLFFFGYSVLKQLLIAYITGYCIVWFYQFFDKNLFFNTLLWQISILNYVLIISPQTSIYANIIGVAAMMIFGIGVLSVNGRPIVTPVLLGVLVGSIQQYTAEPTFTLPYLVFMVQKANTILGNSSFLTALIDANHIIAQVPEKTFLYSNSISAYTELITNYIDIFVQNPKDLFYIIIAPYSFNVSVGSIFVILLAYIMLSFSKIIDPIIPILYSFVFLLIYYLQLIGNPDAIKILLQGFVFNISLWFSSVFIIANNIPINNKKGRYIATIITAVIASMMFYKSYYIINHIFAVIIINISAALIETICKKPVFGISEKIIKMPEKLIFTLSTKYITRIMIGISMIWSVFFTLSLFPNNTFEQRESEYILNVVGDFFPTYRVQKSNFTNIFKAEDIQGETSYIINSDSSLYRTYINILLLVKDDIIKDVKIVKLVTAHSYYIDSQFRELLIDQNINNMTEILDENKIKQYSNKNPFVSYRVIDAFRKGSKIYSEFIKNKRE